MNLLEENKKAIEKNNYANASNVVISEITKDKAVAYIDITEDNLNSYGFVHGGGYFTLADTCAAFAARSDGRNYVTQQASSQFIRNVNKGRVTAEGTVVNRGRTFCIIDVKVTSDEDKLLYTGTFNYFCIDK
ncbi:MAG: PaaI family thioesterase [Agathobacter sp.]|nr:PaaI family thioesterase [Agathobacter sp.]